MSKGQSKSTHMMALYITIPIVVCSLLIGVVLFLLCCSRRYRLNWYERSLLEGSQSSSKQDSERSFLHRPSYTGSGSSGSSFIKPFNINKPPKDFIKHPHFDDNLPPITIGHGSARIITKKVKPQQTHNGSMGSGSSSPNSPDHSPRSSFSEHINEKRISFGGVLPTSNGSMLGRRETVAGICTQGSRRDSMTPSTGSAADIRRDSAEFWVPPNVLQKKRAHSLVPTLETYQGKDSEGTQDSSPSISPGGMIGTNNTGTTNQGGEMIFTYSPEKLSESVSLVQVPGGGGQRRRRASMQDALDPTTINARMYEQMMKSHHDSIGSIQEENLGSLNISLRYNPEQGLLTARLIQARDLVPRDFSGTSDPYCRICLLPNRKFQLHTRHHKNTLYPEFEEEFMFDASPHNLKKRTLEILVYDFDQFSRDECIGQVLLPMEHIDLTEDVVLWKGISPYEKKEETEDQGDVMFSLGYLSSAERLTVVMLKARNLRCSHETKGLPNPFVKVSLISNNKRFKKKKTTTKRAAAFPVWNEALVFSNLNKAMLKSVTIEIVLHSDGLLGNSEEIGRVIVGCDSVGEELSHWNDMLNSKTAMARWHSLQHAGIVGGSGGSSATSVTTTSSSASHHS